MHARRYELTDFEWNRLAGRGAAAAAYGRRVAGMWLARAGVVAAFTL